MFLYTIRKATSCHSLDRDLPSVTKDSCAFRRIEASLATRSKLFK